MDGVGKEIGKKGSFRYQCDSEPSKRQKSRKRADTRSLEMAAGNTSKMMSNWLVPKEHTANSEGKQGTFGDR